ncbi:hypothetical protein [Chamaesiphon sp. OTE_75_metabat_556]|uniref:hypothetical protein n=1 Tax=Chamaesiphon sp. OTE_75_metabat_556 TaxID=2964692 RepID=UPI00286A1572|nr:hypothetical protein [Chamaesiphon sp. OTE_75_metabat_556]
MISSAEFQHKLRSGQIYDALALVVQETVELEITTQMNEDPDPERSADGEYLRTKINLLTGNIQNEVGKNVVTSPNFLKLQQLHLDQLAVSQQGVRGYLEQIQAILAILPANSTINGDGQLPTDLRHPNGQVAELFISSIDPGMNADEDLDLSIDRDDEVWEEWVEDEDFVSSSDILAPPLMAPRMPLPESPPQWVRRPLDPLAEPLRMRIAIKPIAPRAATTPVDPATKWEQFEPEHLGCRIEPQPRINHYPDPQQMDKILADLDI